ncbi:MAG TPA: TadE/TadG family type IV pilus assembly protein [Candidatus Acidoferrales bacterium]|nr:TadE/TadG family type IV pilus assembly protein [Candidatus Acidoferrales bacterium]
MTSRRCGARRLKGNAGSTLVEFAFVFILFMTMLLGIAGFGHALYCYHFTSEVAREATRWAIVNGSTCTDDGSCAAPATPGDIQTFVTNHIPPGITASNVTTTVTFNPAATPGCAPSNAPGCTVEVTVSYQFSFIFPLLPTNPLTMSSTSEMVIAH